MSGAEELKRVHTGVNTVQWAKARSAFARPSKGPAATDDGSDPDEAVYRAAWVWARALATQWKNANKPAFKDRDTCFCVDVLLALRLEVVFELMHGQDETLIKYFRIKPLARDGDAGKPIVVPPSPPSSPDHPDAGGDTSDSLRETRAQIVTSPVGDEPGAAPEAQDQGASPAPRTTHQQRSHWPSTIVVLQTSSVGALATTLALRVRSAMRTVLPLTRPMATCSTQKRLLRTKMITTTRTGRLLTKQTNSAPD